MPARTLLSAEQRTRLFSIPTDMAAMARHYVLEAADLANIRARRRASNRLGFAVQLCILRHPGRVLDPAESPPAPILAFVANQIGGDPALFGEYARRAETRREHLLELQKFLGLRGFGLDAGVPAFAPVRTRHGPRIAASPLSWRCLTIFGPTMSSYLRQQCWSESGWPPVRGHVRRPSRRSRRG